MVSVVLGAVALLLGGGSPALAGDVSSVKIVAPTAVVQDSDFAVGVDIGDVTAFDAGQFDVSFDESLLQLDDVTAGQIGATQIPVDLWNKIGTGTYRIIVNVPDFPGVSGSGSLAVLQFHAASSAVGTSPVNLSNGFLNDNQGAEIVATWTGGSVSVRDNLDIIAPSVVTRGATNVATTSAILNGNLASKGTADNVTVYFEWGLTASYGNVTAAETRSAIGTFSANLTGLIEGIPYHFRAVALGDGSPAHSYDAILTTARWADTTAPVISAVNSSDITVSGSTITWTTNEEATSQVEYGLTEEYGSRSTLDANLVNSHSVALTDLEAGETYHYRVICKDVANNEAVSADATFTTAAPSGDGTLTWAWLLIGGLGAVVVLGGAVYFFRGRQTQL